MLRPLPSSTRAAAITAAEPVGARVARFPTAASLPRLYVTLLRMNEIFQKISEAVADTMASKQAEIDGLLDKLRADIDVLQQAVSGFPGSTPPASPRRARAAAAAPKPRQRRTTSPAPTAVAAQAAPSGESIPDYSPRPQGRERSRSPPPTHCRVLERQ